MKLRIVDICTFFFVFLTGLYPAIAQVNSGVATHFDALGSPTGGCGVPQDLLETQNFVALNVFNSPKNYASYTRPIAGADLQYLGEYDNGLNCGRWVQVTIGPNCVGGTNDGAQNQAFCRGTGAKWVDDKYSGATLYMIVADACADANAWCRDSPYHLDMATASLNLFAKNGTPVNDMYPGSWVNREITWNYVPAPNYTGDINIYVVKGSQQYYVALMINHLPNGIHGIEQKVGNNWTKATMITDEGQVYVLPTANQSSYTIRIYDADDQLLNKGREYTFSFPSSCGGTCAPTVTKVSYTTKDVVTDINEVSLAKDNFYFTVEDELLIAHRRSPSNGTDLSFSVLDMQGHQLATVGNEANSGHQAFVLSKVTRGMYIVVMRSADGQEFSKKVVY
jgi:hypothetical protein